MKFFFSKKSIDDIIQVKDHKLKIIIAPVVLIFQILYTLPNFQFLFAKDETQALSLSKDKKVLDVIDIVERFEQSLLANHDLLYLDVAKLAVQCSEKSEQEMVWAFLTYQLGKEIQNPQARRWLDLVFKAREMWLANVSFQNAMEYLVLS